MLVGGGLPSGQQVLLSGMIVQVFLQRNVEVEKFPAIGLDAGEIDMRAGFCVVDAGNIKEEESAARRVRSYRVGNELERIDLRHGFLGDSRLVLFGKRNRQVNARLPGKVFQMSKSAIDVVIGCRL